MRTHMYPAPLLAFSSPPPCQRVPTGFAFQATGRNGKCHLHQVLKKNATGWYPLALHGARRRLLMLELTAAIRSNIEDVSAAGGGGAGGGARLPAVHAEVVALQRVDDMTTVEMAARSSHDDHKAPTVKQVCVRVRVHTCVHMCIRVCASSLQNCRCRCPPLLPVAAAAAALGQAGVLYSPSLWRADASLALLLPLLLGMPQPCPAGRPGAAVPQHAGAGAWGRGQGHGAVRAGGGHGGHQRAGRAQGHPAGSERVGGVGGGAAATQLSGGRRGGCMPAGGEVGRRDRGGWAGGEGGAGRRLQGAGGQRSNGARLCMHPPPLRLRKCMQAATVVTASAALPLHLA